MLKMIPAACKAAFPHTIPVLTGFFFLGAAYGILMSSSGYSWFWVLLMSIFVFAGALQFVGIHLLTSAFDPLNAFLIALAINARHLFYGISMLEKYSGTGYVKPYLIFGMCDETFSILHGTKPPPHIDKKAFMLAVTLLNQAYWIIGGIIGGVIEPFIIFDLRGLDFVMTAFFVVIFINQWKERKNHLSALIGLSVAAVSLFIFGAERFIIPAMILIVICLTIFQKRVSDHKNMKGVDD